jgi:hypothetical protein
VGPTCSCGFFASRFVGGPTVQITVKATLAPVKGNAAAPFACYGGTLRAVSDCFTLASRHKLIVKHVQLY